ncbi:hypothetical protein SAMN02745146_3562 [Hymenobacter daecheongensis DSM 21074]|uniref:Zinc-finger n=2 Tax=Hymenobacter daecheongensis TaxID=496053 RepID=A0A1M6KTX1_9BACT|nr:hypothetical protein SAMN02745146_3562 [Hymenobacter daecheongensis DSM 21074]
MLNCYQVTRLLEIKAEQPLSWGTLLAMRVHLRLCVLCRRYQQQTYLIARAARPAANLNQVQLREEFKAQLRARLQQRAAALGAAPDSGAD